MAYNQDDNLEKELLKYKAVYPQAPIDMKYHYYDGDVLKIRPETSTLIKSIDELREYVNSCKGVKIAVDTETTGLTYDKDFVVGFSIAKDMYHGVYVPIRHQIRLTTKIKEIKRDAEGNPILTKTGKNSMHTVEYYDDRDNPLNLPAKEALDILFYDIIKYKTKSGKGTGINELQEINTPLTKALIEYRKMEKLIDAFLVALPKRIEPSTGKIHTSLNQYGAATGRFSSSAS